jgi:hypothetical protein
VDARRRRERWLQGGATRERFTSRRTYDADAYGKTVWFWHPWLVSSCRWQNRSNRIGLAIKPAAMEARGIRLQGEHGISRKAIAQGMPECSDCTCMLVGAFPCVHCTRDRGCSVHPAFPAPSVFWGGDKFMQASGAMRRENAKSYLRRMGRAQRNPSPVRTGLDGYRCAPPILRTSRPCERSEAIHSAACGAVDCFALLAMARIGRGVPDTPACVGYHAPFGPPKILQPAARSRFRSRPCERPFLRSKLTMTDQSVIL